MWFPNKNFLLFATIIWQISGHVIETDTNHDEILMSDMKSSSGKTSHDSSEISSDHLVKTTSYDYNVKQVKSNVSLQWLSESEMKIIWPNQGEDIINVTASMQFPNSELICIFEGNPMYSGTTIFSAAIVGCLDSEETVVNLGVNNTVLELLLLKNGTTLENIWNDSRYSKAKQRREKRELTEFEETGAYVQSSVPSAARNEIVNKKYKQIPKDIITFPLDLGYDKGFKEYFGSDSKTKAFLLKTAVLAQHFFKQTHKLPIIQWNIKNDIEPYINIKITADELCDKSANNMKNLEAKKTLRNGVSTPLILFVKDLQEKGSKATTGCAFKDAACGNTEGEALAIVDMSWPYQESHMLQFMARTMAHEFGHLVGMRHDFDHSPSKECDHTGLMSYGEKPDTWSTCSVDDFETWWSSIGYACEEVKVNCVWSDLKPLTDCTKSCGGGTQFFTRSKIQEARNGGRECEGDEYLVQPCNEDSCKDV